MPHKKWHTPHRKLVTVDGWDPAAVHAECTAVGVARAFAGLTFATDEAAYNLCFETRLDALPAEKLE